MRVLTRFYIFVTIILCMCFDACGVEYYERKITKRIARRSPLLAAPSQRTGSRLQRDRRVQRGKHGTQKLRQSDDQVHSDDRDLPAHRNGLRAQPARSDVSVHHHQRHRRGQDSLHQHVARQHQHAHRQVPSLHNLGGHSHGHRHRRTDLADPLRTDGHSL